MFQGVKSGWDLIKGSIKVFRHYPKFVVPLIITWLLYAPIILYFKYWFNWDAYANSQVFVIVFGITFLFAFLLSFSCSMLLELIQQLESGQKMSVMRSFSHTLTRNAMKILPVVLVWTVIWFILLIIQALLSKSKKRERESFSVQDAAKTLAGYQNFSFSKAFFQALEKGVRMIIFLILPAIAWENLSFWQSVKKGVAVFKSNLTTFTTGFTLTGLATTVVFLPPALFFYISGELEITHPDWVLVVAIVYIAFAWSYSIYLEQMFAAQLYLWNYKWEKAVKKAQQEGLPIPSINEIPHPSVLDDVHELIEKSNSFS